MVKEGETRMRRKGISSGEGGETRMRRRGISSGEVGGDKDEEERD